MWPFVVVLASPQIEDALLPCAIGRCGLRDDKDLKPTVRRELAAGMADVLDGRAAGMSAVALQARARRTLEAVIVASDGVPFDHTYDLRDLLIQRHIDGPTGPFQNFATDAVMSLHDQGVDRSEQSVSLGKLKKRFTQDTMDQAHARAGAAGRNSEVEFLAMMPTDQTLSATSSPREFVGLLGDLRQQLQRPDVRGIDIAGPEAQRFTPEGMARFRALLDVAKQAAATRGTPIVLRPHVGEGYDPHHTGDHVAIARDNLEMLVSLLERQGYSPGTGVIVRFGHATHASPDQLRRIRALGVIVEANVGSNLATGSILRAEDHPLLANLYHGVPTVLHGFVPDEPDTALDDLTPELIRRSVLDAFAFYDAHADADRAPP